MTYDATLKQSSTMKATMNAFLAACIRTDSKAIVIDAEKNSWG